MVHYLWCQIVWSSGGYMVLHVPWECASATAWFMMEGTEVDGEVSVSWCIKCWTIGRVRVVERCFTTMPTGQSQLLGPGQWAIFSPVRSKNVVFIFWIYINSWEFSILLFSIIEFMIYSLQNFLHKRKLFVQLLCSCYFPACKLNLLQVCPLFSINFLTNAWQTLITKWMCTISDRYCSFFNINQKAWQSTSIDDQVMRTPMC